MKIQNFVHLLSASVNYLGAKVLAFSKRNYTVLARNVILFKAKTRSVRLREQSIHVLLCMLVKTAEHIEKE